ncbi:unnamed protein product [Vicia faba]|uniref:Uncharacterized protein n=1 Tax=Vicia faba TaxID=3906 RepID=A0AAV1AB97_VICFA|nr:unnamed protein product [Vicia faba]
MGSLVRGWKVGGSYYFFRLPVILLSQVPSALDEFSIIVTSKYLDFIHGLSTIATQGIFSNASRNLFKAGSFVSIVFVSPNDVMGSIELLRERDEVKETCEALERKNYDAEKELPELRANVDVVNSL